MKFPFLKKDGIYEKNTVNSFNAWFITYWLWKERSKRKAKK